MTPPYSFSLAFGSAKRTQLPCHFFLEHWMFSCTALVIDFPAILSPMNLSDSLKLSLARKSLSRFAQVVMPAFEVDPCHKLIIENLEFLLNGKIKKLAIITPPRHGQSTM